MPSIGGYSLEEVKDALGRALLTLCDVLPHESMRQTFRATDEGTIVLCMPASRLGRILGRVTREELALRTQPLVHADPSRSRWHPKPASDLSKPFSVEVYMPGLLNDETCRELIEEKLWLIASTLRYDGVELVDKTVLWRPKSSRLPEARLLLKRVK